MTLETSMILRTIEKHDTKNIWTSEKSGSDVIMTIYEVISDSPVFARFWANWMLDSYKVQYRGEWPSGLRRCNKNRKVPGSKPARRSAGLRDPTSLRGPRWPSGRLCTNAVINIGLVRLSLENCPKLAVGQPNSS